MSRIAPNTPTRQREPRAKDKRYTDSFKGTACEACGAEDGTVVGAHVRAGNEGGTGYKPDDSLVVGLCHSCHADQEANPGAAWWFEHIFKNMLRDRYRATHTKVTR